MKVKCPSCGAVASLDLLVSTMDSKQAVLAAFDVPPVLKQQVIAYLGLFRPAKRKLTAKRLATLLNTLTPPINTGEVVVDRQRYSVSLDAWSWALEQVAAARDKGSLMLPLDGHNYLFKVVIHYDARKHAHAPKPAAPAAKKTDEVDYNPLGLKPLTKLELLEEQRQRKAADSKEQTPDQLKTLVKKLTDLP